MCFTYFCIWYKPGCKGHFKLGAMLSHNFREKKQFLWLYLPPAFVELLPPTKASLCHQLLWGSPRWYLLDALEMVFSATTWHLSVTSLVAHPALTPFGDVFFKASGLCKTLFRWPLAVAAATVLMWVTFPTDAKGQSVLIFLLNGCFSPPLGTPVIYFSTSLAMWCDRVTNF